ncbi:MAG: MBOAT family O-acyltransferase [Bacteroidales bacterium]
MDKSKNDLQRKLILALSISINLGLLFYFKYSNFFIENVNAISSVFGINSIHWTKLILPLGISFFTFETITYVVDVYRRTLKPLKNFWDYQLYIILFPKLIAGPIIRYHEISDQITNREHNETIDNRLTGFFRFVLGLAKKVLIANVMGQVADEVFALNYNEISSYTAWIGILAYTFQIYFDFSGYSDMAIGIGKMLGFRFPENFDNPYISKNITEFWTRWHISLSKWLRIYIFLPLAFSFSRKLPKEKYIHIKSEQWIYMYAALITFFCCGLWHGASWSFVLWGLYYGVFLILEKIFLLKVYKKLGKFLSTVLTFLLVIIGWVFFRIEKLSDTFVFIKRMFAFEFKYDFYFNREFITILFIAIFFAFFAYSEKGKKIQLMIYGDNYSMKRYYFMSFVSLLLLILSVSSITGSGFNPFIYFRF